MSETEETAQAVAEDVATPEEAVAEAVTEEPVAAVEPVVDAEPVADEPIAEEAIVVEAPPGVRQARILLCERGHRTAAIWSEPTVCHARPTRSGPECGRPLYPIGELPEQVQKALNPLKASKKASKG